jgi:hypothetical protein
MILKTETKASPKGLIKSHTTRGWDPNGVRLETIGQDEYAIKGPALTEIIRSQMAVFKERATRCIVRAGHDPAQYWKLLGSETLDRVLWAARMLKTLSQLEHHLYLLERSNLDPEARLNAFAAVHSALILTSEYHGWTVVDNEPAIDARLRSVDGAKRGSAGKARATQARDIELAHEYLARRSKPGGQSNSALMEEIGKTIGLGRSASIAAIKRGLKNIPK